MDIEDVWEEVLVHDNVEDYELSSSINVLSTDDDDAAPDEEDVAFSEEFISPPSSPPTHDPVRARTASTDDGTRSSAFKQAVTDDYQKMIEDPDSFRAEKLLRRVRRLTEVPQRLPAPETIEKSLAYKQLLEEKYNSIAADSTKYKADLLQARSTKLVQSDGDFSKVFDKKKPKKLPFGQKNDSRTRSKSTPPLSFGASITLGSSLSSILLKESSSIPSVIQKSISFLSQDEAIRTEGLFRVAGNTNLVELLLRAVEQGEDIPPDADVHTVSSMFKKFVRTLAEPLFTYRLHKDFLDAAALEDSEESIKALRDVFNRLPPPNQNVVREVISFLRKVRDLSSVNMMHEFNLGVVFGPSLMRDASEALGPGAMFDNRNQVVASFIQNSHEILSEEKYDR